MQEIESLDVIQARAVDALRRYPHESDSDATRCLRTTAEAFVGAREHFYTRTGATDWLGQTGAYRAWVRETMVQADLEPGTVTTVQNAIRYHVGNVLRDRLDAETLTALGLRTIGPRGRSVEKRAGQAAILGVFSGGARIRNADEMIAALQAVEVGLRRFDVGALGKRDAARVREAASGVRAEVDALLG